MTYRDYQRTAQGVSRGMVIVGGIIMLVCVGFLTVSWWQEGRWVWVVLGILLIVVDIALVILTFRKPSLTPPGSGGGGTPAE
ncbi:hypothetical protein GCM10009624_25280 [Gordonia sinesedis]